jgi:hypothetical protein
MDVSEVPDALPPPSEWQMKATGSSEPLVLICEAACKSFPADRVRNAVANFKVSWFSNNCELCFTHITNKKNGMWKENM